MEASAAGMMAVERMIKQTAVEIVVLDSCHKVLAEVNRGYTMIVVLDGSLTSAEVDMGCGMKAVHEKS